MLSEDRTAEGRVEGFGLVYLEANAWANPLWERQLAAYSMPSNTIEMDSLCSRTTSMPWRGHDSAAHRS